MSREELDVSREGIEAQLIDAVCARVRERLPDRLLASCEAFVLQYYHWVTPQDLAGASPLDLYGAAIAHWNLLQQRAPGEAKIRVYNPKAEKHGWQSEHMLLDSVTMELTRQGYGIDLVIHPVIGVRRDDEGRLTEVPKAGATSAGALRESVLHGELTREHDRELLAQLRENIERVLGEVRSAVEDWEAMRGRACALSDELKQRPPLIDTDEVDEDRADLVARPDRRAPAGQPLEGARVCRAPR